MLFRSLRYNWPLQVDSPLPAVPFQTTHPSQCAKIISAHYWFNHDNALGLQWLTVTWRIEAKLLYRAQRSATILTPLQLYLLTKCPNQILLSGFTKLPEAPYSALVFKPPLLSNPYSWVLYALTIPLCSQQRHLLLLPISAWVTHRESFPLPLLLCQPHGYRLPSQHSEFHFFTFLSPCSSLKLASLPYSKAPAEQMLSKHLLTCSQMMNHVSVPWRRKMWRRQRVQEEEKHHKSGKWEERGSNGISQYLISWLQGQPVILGTNHCQLKLSDPFKCLFQSKLSVSQDLSISQDSTFSAWYPILPCLLVILTQGYNA